MFRNIEPLTKLVIVTGTKISFIAATKSCLEFPARFCMALRTMYMSSTPNPIMINGRVHAMLRLILIPDRIAQPICDNRWCQRMKVFFIAGFIRTT